MLLFAFIPEEDTYIAKDGKRYFDPTCGDSFEVKELTDQNIKLSPPTIKEEEANHGKK